MSTCFWSRLVHTDQVCDWGTLLLENGTVDLIEQFTGLSGNISQTEIAQTVEAIFIADMCDQSGVISFLSGLGYSVDGTEMVEVFVEDPQLGARDTNPAGNVTARETIDYFDALRPWQAPHYTVKINATVYDVRTNTGGFFSHWTAYAPITSEHPEGGAFALSDAEIYTAISPFLEDGDIGSMLTDCESNELYANIQASLS